jgi:NAD(P)-dependent dehydrogenase (short-subunit alcohol dehydrogenase family)
MTEPFFANPECRAKTLSRIPLGWLGAVEDLMGAIVFLASDASSMTGTSSPSTADGAGNLTQEIRARAGERV